MAETWQRVIVGLEVDKVPTIDPESLPIVRQLRAELERVTAERDKIAQYELDACGEYCFGDSSTGIPECEWLDSNGRCKLKEWVKENTAGKGDVDSKCANTGYYKPDTGFCNDFAPKEAEEK